MKLTVFPFRNRIRGEIEVPVSKYHLHRALIFGSLAEGTTLIRGRSNCGHIKDTLHALRDLGIRIDTLADGYRVVGGPYRSSRNRIFVGGCGSTLQFLLGLGCYSDGPVTYDGNRLLRGRPIGPLLDALSQVGVRWRSADHCLPVTVLPGLPNGGAVRIPGTLSQWASGLLMLAPFARHATSIEITPPFNERNYIALTLAMLRQFGIRVQGSLAARRFLVPPRQHYQARTIEIEADISSAAFLLAVAALHPADMVLTGIDRACTHPEGKILPLLRQMGVPLRFHSRRHAVIVRHNGVALRPIVADMRTIPDLIPILSVLAAAAPGRSVLRNIAPCRLKECDRVKAMRVQLGRMGASLEEDGDDLVIHGGRPLTGSAVSSYDDHRVEMALAVAGTIAQGPTHITYPRAFRLS
ncbi:MAG: 3-phosphoshikimate 1-carboxyvinyltransferase, partial [Limisphaerales bacterium]